MTQPQSMAVCFAPAPADARSRRRWQWWSIALAYLLMAALALLSIWYIDRGAMHDELSQPAEIPHVLEP